MDGIAVIRVVRQVRVIRFANINEADQTSSLLQQQPPRKNNRCLNAIVLLIIYFIGIGSIIMGAVHLNDCPENKMIPKFLVIFGVALTFSRLLNCKYDYRSVCEEECTEDIPPGLVSLNLSFFLIEFMMFLSLCIFTFLADPTTNPEDHDLPNYCHYGLYKTSFYGCIIGLIYYGLIIVLIVNRR